MYTEYFRLKESPFAITPDPAYFYVSEQHREALAHLMYCFNSDGGFVLLTGEVGTGKTTVCRRLLQKAPADCNIAFVLYPKLTGEELLAAICDDFGIAHSGEEASSRVLVSKIYDYLVQTHESGRKAILIIEEAQNLGDEVLEQIRLLTNLETNKRKLLQIVMLGQPELREKLARPELRQLAQRITAQYHLTPFSREDVSGYVNHRLAVAGSRSATLFTPSALKELYRLTKGVPRLINVICDRALTGAYIEGKDAVDKRILGAAAREVSVRLPERPRFVRPSYVVAVSAAVLAIVAGVALRGWVFTENGKANLATVPPQVATRSAPMPSNPPLSEPVMEKVTSLENLSALDGGADAKASREAALRTLLHKWNIKSRAVHGQDVCSVVAADGLACLSGRESIDGLRRLNRPAIIRLSDDKGISHYVALTGFSGNRAVLTVAGKEVPVDVTEMGRRWSGDYELFWPLPPGYLPKLKQGDKGAMIAWLNKQLAAAEGRSPSPQTNLAYSAETAQRLRQFQVRAGLVPDGMVGAKTAIQLRDTTANSDPRLIQGE